VAIGECSPGYFMIKYRERVTCSVGVVITRPPAVPRPRRQIWRATTGGPEQLSLAYCRSRHNDGPRLSGRASSRYGRRMVNAVRCPGCGVKVPEIDGPTHAYMLSAPACWERYCALEDWKAGLVRGEGFTTIQNLVDTYAAQHASNLDRRNRRSVAVHLMSLCAGLEQGVSGKQRRSRIGIWVRREYPALEPRPAGFAITAPDVASAAESTRPSMIDQMATLTWSAWVLHHNTIRAWLAEADDSVTEAPARWRRSGSDV